MSKRRRILKSTIAMIVLVATVLNTGFSTVASEIVVDNDIVVENDIVEETNESDDIEIEVVSDKDAEEEDEEEEISVQSEDADEEIVEEKSSTKDDEIIEEDEEISALSDDAEIEEEDISEDDEETEENELSDELKEGTLELNSDGITGSGYDSISVYINTEKLATKDTFSILFNGPDSASYNPIINDTLDKTNDGYYDFDDLDGSDFSIRIKTRSNLDISTAINSDGMPEIILESLDPDEDKILDIENLTYDNGTRVKAITGSGYESLTLNITTENFTDKNTYSLYVETDADVTANGESVGNGLSGFTTETESITIENLDNESFNIYVLPDKEEINLEATPTIENVEDGVISYALEIINERRIYEYEDDKVYVKVTLEDPDAIPDDAYFCVTPIDDTKKYLEALNENDPAEDEEESYTEENTLLYDIAFYTDDTKDEEIEPKDGSVKVAVEFKKNQLEEEIGATEEDEIEIAHIVEEGRNIEAEIIEAEVSVEDGTVEFNTDSFSIYSFTNKANRTKIDPLAFQNLESLLGDAINYGVVADSLYFSGDMETTLAVNKFDFGGGQVKSPKYDTSSGTGGIGGGIDYIGKVTSSNAIFQLNGSTIGTKTIYVGDKGKTDSEKTGKKITAHSGVYVDSTSMSESDISSIVSSLRSTPLATSSMLHDASKVDCSDEFSNGNIDLSSNTYTSGIYCVKCDVSGGYLQFPKNIKIREDQIIVFDCPSNVGDITIQGPIEMVLVKSSGESKYHADGNSEQVAKHVIFNCYDAGVSTSKLQSSTIDGTFLCPNRDYNLVGVTGGWVLANNARITGSEFHCLYKDTPVIKNDKVKYSFNVTKNVEGGEWPEGKEFTFELRPYYTNDGRNTPHGDAPMPAGSSTDANGVYYRFSVNKSNPVATVDLPEFDAKSILELIESEGNGSWTYSDNTLPGGRCLNYMYTITEVGASADDVIVNDTHTEYIKLWINVRKDSDTYVIKLDSHTNNSVTSNCQDESQRPVEFTNTINKGSLIIRKTFDGDCWNYLTDSQKATLKDALMFKVTDESGNYTEYTYSQFDANGTLTISDLSIGSKYTVEEINNLPNGYKCVTTYTVGDRSGSGRTVEQVEINGTDAKIVAFTNRYTYEATGKLKLSAKKILTGRDITAEDEFKFTLTGYKNVNQTKSTKTDSTDKRTVVFDELTFDQNDIGKEIHYTIVEEKGNISGITYSDATVDVTVTVTDNGDGTLNVSANKATVASPAEFTNVYDAKGGVIFKVTKTISGSGTLTNDKKFYFELKEVGKTNPIETIFTKGEGEASFKALDYGLTDKGEHKYTISEKIPEQAVGYPEGSSVPEYYMIPIESEFYDGIKYDPTVHEVTVNVRDDGSGQLVITKTLDGTVVEENQTVNATFTNSYQPRNLYACIEGKKEIVDNKVELKDGDFTFKFVPEKDYGDAIYIPVNGEITPCKKDYGQIKVTENGETYYTSKNLASGELGLHGITFNKPGVYKFTVSEIDEHKPGYIYDKNSYTWTFDIVDSGTGYLMPKDPTSMETEVEVIKSTTTGSLKIRSTEMIFRNDYDADGEATIKAQKVLRGDIRTLTPGEFEFELLDGIGENAKPVSTSKRTAGDGSVTFDSIQYTLASLDGAKEKDFVYYVHEVLPDNLANSTVTDASNTERKVGYIYDEKYHKVTVNVKLNEKDNKLETKVTYDDGDVATITNEYKSYGSVTIGGNKVMSGRRLKDGDNFVAQLYDSTGLIDTAKIEKNAFDITGKNGSFTFKTLEYTMPGTYHYTVKESSTGNSPEGVTMDERTYDVTVTVVDDTNNPGRLICTPSYKIGSSSYDSITFTNIYNAKGSVHFEASKTLNGATIENGQFTFNLYEANKSTDGTFTLGRKIYSQDNKGAAVVFDEIEYEAKAIEDSENGSREFVYFIKEENKGKTGFTYDDKVYAVKVTVSEDGDALSVTTPIYYSVSVAGDVYTIGGEVADGAVFENGYTASGSVELSLNKKLIGTAMTERQFAFELYDGNNVLQTIYSKASEDGVAAESKFAPITYTQADLNETASKKISEDGTYAKYYYIREATEDGNGYTCDQSIWSVVVTLKDNGNGTIATDWYAYKDAFVPEKSTLTSIVDQIKSLLNMKTSSQQIDFVNEYNANGKVVFAAHKIVTGTTALPKAGDFEFVLKGTAEDGSAINEVAPIDADGNVTFNEIVYTHASTTPYEYTIEEVVPETNKKPGFTYDTTKYTATVYVSNGQGVLNVNTVIKVGDDTISTTQSTEVTVDGVKTGVCAPAAVDFTNPYTTTGTYVDLAGTKSVANRKADVAQDEFTFKIEGINGTTLPAAYNDTVKVNAGGTFSFDRINYEYSDLGGALSKEFEYQISEVPGRDESINYTTVKKVVKVTVRDNGNGTMSATPDYVDGVLAFVNTYNASNEVQFYAKKEVEGTNSTDKTFTFKLTGDGITEPKTVTVTNGNIGTFGKINYVLADLDGEESKTFNYVIEEVPADDSDAYKGYEFSSEKYNIAVTVENKTSDGKLTVNYTVEGDTNSNTCDSVVFHNKYTAYGETKIVGTKELQNRDLTDGEFTFGLYEEGASEPILTTTNDADGNFSFTGWKAESSAKGYTTELQYDQSEIGKHYYEVKEIIPEVKDENVTYNVYNSVYKVLVDVTDNGNGTLKADTTITDETSKATVEKTAFVNKFQDSKSVSFDAVKTLTGKLLADDEFSFTLKQTKGSKIADFEKGEETVWNNGQTVTFTPIEFTEKEKGEYEFTISENDLGETNVEYSKELYTAKVVVSIKNGRLDIQKIITNKAGQTLEADKPVEFENVFESSTKVQFGGEKTLAGFASDKIAKGQYQFKIVGTDGTTLPADYVSIVDVDANGKYSFAEITYNQNDLYVDGQQLPSKTFTYDVSEVVNGDKAANVKYDSTVYHITVVVKLADGKVVAEPSVVAEGEATTTATITTLNFTNKYEDTNEWIPVATKNLSGKNITDEAYSFNITATDENHNALTGDEAYTETVKNNGKSVTFTKISYDQNDIGDHYYTITETLSEDGSAKDESKYYAKVTVDVDENNELTVDVSYTKVEIKDGKEEVTSPDSIVFNNIFTDSTSIKIGGDKILIGRDLKEGEFEFVLEGTDGIRLTATNDAATMNDDSEATDSFEFPEIEYNQDVLADGNGGYLESKQITYTVYENGIDAYGVTNSTAKYSVVVTISYEDGKLTAKAGDPVSTNPDAKEEGFFKSLVSKIFGSKKNITFINEYFAECEIDPEGIKQLLGREIKDGEFTFIIEELEIDDAGNSTGKVINRGSVQNYTVDGKTKIEFSGPDVQDSKNGYFLRYSTSGYSTINGQTVKCTKVTSKEQKHLYRIYEDTSDAADGIIYDDKSDPDNAVEFSVVVYDTSEGVLAVKDGSGKAWEEAKEDIKEKLSFINKFEATGAIEIAGTKKMDGRELTKDKDYDEVAQKGKYSFTITDLETGESKTVNNDMSNGVPSEIRFTGVDEKDANYVPFLSYNSSDEGAIGTHEYKIVEEKYDSEGVTSDKNYYILKVKVAYADKDGNEVSSSDADKISSTLLTEVISVKKYDVNGVLLADDAPANWNLFDFVNVFKAKGAIKLNGKKSLVDATGSDVGTPAALNGKFDFALYKYSNEDRTANRELISRVVTDENGNFTFDLNNFSQKDLKNVDNSYDTTKTLYYRIVEIPSTTGSWLTDENGKQVWEGTDGVRYDSTVYDVDVTVTYDGTEQLVVTKKATYSDDDGNKVEVASADYDAHFTNITQEYVTIAGTKYWVDNVTNAATRPDVVVSLYSSAVNNGNTAINTYTIVAPNRAYSFTTDAEGNKLPAYVKGKKVTYTVREADIPGYVSEINGYDLYNTSGNITIRKIDAVTRETVSGATLAILTTSGTEVERWTSTVSAHVVATQLTAGTTYILREIDAPDGYEVAADVRFTVPTDGSDITVVMEDTPIVGSVRLVKRDSSTRATLAGAEFAMYSYGGERIYATGSTGSYRYTKTTSNGRFVTDGAGVLTVTDLPYGTYYFVETKAPDGYELSDERVSFSVTTNGALAEVSFLNTKATGSVRLRKTNATGTRSLAGAVFELYVASPQTLGQAATSTLFSDAYYRYGTYRTNAAGEIYVDGLPWDDYYFIEVDAPTGFVVSTDTNGEQLVYTFRIDSTSTETIDLGGITNDTEGTTPPTEGRRTSTVLGARRTTPTGVLGARVEKGGVMSGVLGVRAKPTSGVLGERVGPVTGDFSNIALWLLLLVASVGMIVTMLIKSSKRDKNSKATK